MQRRIGEFMTGIDAITEDEVLDVLETQENRDTRRFGDIALEKGYIRDDSIKRYLDYLENSSTQTDYTCKVLKK